MMVLQIPNKHPHWEANGKRYEPYAINRVVGNLRTAFEAISDDLTSPRRKIARIAKEWTNGCSPIAVSWYVLECGHSLSPIYRKHDYNLAHRDDNHIAKPGDVMGCPTCRRYNGALAMLKALEPGEMQHARFRTRDSRGIGAGDYYVYARDPKSPTGVVLYMSIEATPEVEDVLRSKRLATLSPTEVR
jgi:hypothetical protein